MDKMFLIRVVMLFLGSLISMILTSLSILTLHWFFEEGDRINRIVAEKDEDVRGVLNHD
jgi:hypothetical protein